MTSPLALKIEKRLLIRMNKQKIIKTIVISEDLFSKLTSSDVYKLEQYLAVGHPLKWMIVNRKQNYLRFIYL